MTDELVEADYVIVGGGAVGLSFADVVLTESDSDVLIVDRHSQPGGHWNDAYSFVRLHQPSSFYGVNSKPLGRGRIDSHGPNAGLFELASGREVCTYFEELMHDHFLPSGRVRYFPLSVYEDGRVTSLLTGKGISVRARRRTVDARYVGSEVPSTHVPGYSSAPEVHMVPVNELSRPATPPKRYVIIGAGKTGVDACLWLLGQGVDPSGIAWVRPRDSWFLDRSFLQGGEAFFERTMGAFATLAEVASVAESIDDLYLRMEEASLVMRIDSSHWPTMFRSATMTRGEVELLRQVTDVVRLGRVVHIDPDKLVLERGTVPVAADWLFVDCSAAGIRDRPPVPIFDGDRITLQNVMYGGIPTYGAALTAYVELIESDDDLKNALCRPLPITGDLLDVPRNLLGDLEVRSQWLASTQVRAWMSRSRLDPVMGVASRIDPADDGKLAVVGRYVAGIEPARTRLRQLLGSLDTMTP